MKSFRISTIFACLIIALSMVSFASARTSVSVHIGGHYGPGPGFHGHHWGHGYWVRPWYHGVVVPPVIVAPPVIVEPAPVVVAPAPVVVQTAPVVYTQPVGTVAGVQVPDYDGLTAIGQKMKMQGTVQPITQTATQAAASQPASPADKLVDEGVKAFSAKDYATACDKFRSAVRLEPNDTVLPFMYAQALFANNEYEKSASVLDTVLTEMGPRQQRDVFYPRGLYSNETILQNQIKNLERAVNMDPKNADLHLLLGYHYLGTGRLDEARSMLAPALNDKLSALPAQSLVNLIEQVKQTPQTDPNSVKK